MTNIVGNTVKFLLECKENGEVLSKQAPPSIYMVPNMVRDLSPSSFTPKVVAIGPLHRQDEHLKGFEVQKTAYLHKWLHRSGMVPEKTLQECAEKVIRSIERIKACYEGLTTYGDFELAKMMVLDACFILEFIHSLSEGVASGTNVLIPESIVNDLMLIENQIPFFVLQDIFECGLVASGRSSFTTHIEGLVKYYYLLGGDSVAHHDSAPDHMLGFLHEYFRPAKPMPRAWSSMAESVSVLESESESESPMFESERSMKGHTAMELDRAGMNFKPHIEDQKWVLAMKLKFPLPLLFPWLHIFMTIPPFSWFQRPTLWMPKLRIDDDSELVLRNLVVYEQAFGVEKYLTSYLTALDMLIDTPEDVALLVKSKVMVSGFGSNQEAADMINKLCKNITVKSYYNPQWEQVDAYYNSYWPHTLAVLKRTYFNNPWSIIALIAAFLLFCLTIIQTVFTIKAA